MQRILDIIVQEDHERLFTGESHPNIYDALAPISDSQESKEIERAIKYYFEQVMQVATPNTKIYFEAQKMLEICEKMFEKMHEDVPVMKIRGIIDDIVDYYMNSLQHFASYVQEDLLEQHIEYLNKEF